LPSLSIRQKALNYVLGLRIKPYRFVDAGEDIDNYFVRYENEFKHGQYFRVTFPKKTSKDIESEVLKAMNHLEWIAAGQEFPTP
jgi:hypothetical protein